MDRGDLEGSGRDSGRDFSMGREALLSVRATQQVLYFESMLVVLRDAAQKSKKVHLRTAEEGMSFQVVAPTSVVINTFWLQKGLQKAPGGHQPR